MPDRSPLRLRQPVLFAALLGLLLLLVAGVVAYTVSVGGRTSLNKTYASKGLVAVGRIPADLRDKFGETLGSGSGIAADPQSWKRTAQGYEGTFYILPDRGYNIAGTIDYRARLNQFAISIKPLGDPVDVPPAERQSTIVAKLTDTMLLTDRAGEPLTGLDPVGVRAAANGLPDLPQAVNGRVSIDTEALVRLADGSFLIGDEYGPYVYRFSATGQLVNAIRPPEAIIPKRQGRDNFSSNNPAAGASPPEPRNPERGRQNNQGLEGVSLVPGGRLLVAALQSATRQDSSASPDGRRYTRVLYYDVSNIALPRLVREYVVPLPVFEGADGKPAVAAQSELLALDETHFFLLCRDSGNGFGTPGATSRYRKVVLVDAAGATNIAGSPYDGVVPVAPDGKLVDGIVPATLTPFIDINDNAELRKFGLHNGEPNNRDNLSEKWEGMALVPALDPANPDDALLVITNDNDFITQNGHHAGADYRDASGVDVDTMLLAYRITLPEQPK